MTELQEKLLDILKWFSSFCEENNLRYYLLGGTMLGAMRHEGFIPWDDDIDVGMPRADYERMAQILSENPSEQYAFETPNTEETDYYYPFSKIYDTSTTLIENTKHQIKRGIYIDVFPLDGIGNTEEEAKINYKKVKKIYQLLMTRVGKVRKGRGFVKNAAVVLMQAIPKFILNDKKILKQLDAACAERSFDDCEYIGNLVGNWWEKEIIPKEIMGEPTDCTFEGLTVKGPANADKYLTYIYGDWRKLPPEEKRISHHDFILIDLYKSYLGD